MTLTTANTAPEWHFGSIEGKELDRIFLTTLLLTSNVEDAEASMLEAIDRQTRGRPLLETTIEVAIRRKSNFIDGDLSRLSAPLSIPIELRRVLLLPAQQRQCFVLLTLVGMPVYLCSDLLRLAEIEVKGNAVSAAVSLADCSEDNEEPSSESANISVEGLGLATDPVQFNHCPHSKLRRGLVDQTAAG